jgi:Spy/CpxP family protein refolding chaperone
MKRTTLATALLTLSLSLGTVTLAHAHEGRKDHGARIQEHMQQAAERLKLTDAQKQQLQPIVEEHIAQAKVIRDKYPAEASRERKRQMLEEMHALRKDYDGKVRAVLSEEQQQEWEKMRSERRERMREHRRERKDQEST